MVKTTDTLIINACSQSGDDWRLHLGVRNNSFVMSSMSVSKRSVCHLPGYYWVSPSPADAQRNLPVVPGHVRLLQTKWSHMEGVCQTLCVCVCVLTVKYIVIYSVAGFRLPKAVRGSTETLMVFMWLKCINYIINGERMFVVGQNIYFCQSMMLPEWLV